MPSTREQVNIIGRERARDNLFCLEIFILAMRTFVCIQSRRLFTWFAFWGVSRRVFVYLGFWDLPARDIRWKARNPIFYLLNWGTWFINFFVSVIEHLDNSRKFSFDFSKKINTEQILYTLYNLYLKNWEVRELLHLNDTQWWTTLYKYFYYLFIFRMILRIV